MGFLVFANTVSIHLSKYLWEVLLGHMLNWERMSNCFLNLCLYFSPAVHFSCFPSFLGIDILICFYFIFFLFFCFLFFFFFLLFFFFFFYFFPFFMFFIFFFISPMCYFFSKNWTYQSKILNQLSQTYSRSLSKYWIKG